ncbi:endonuclease/exonuclease/phosphatase family protein [Mangrovimonas sp. DI 80]|uniref:endonuclease/exonuclease/phosphatase family protein n=1 Tax=Mangrovimonas sp. DI 80 TaxID=1779330 RepID=UPI001558BF7A|nr:endonuclease/exonuclease/phosphatase family protein [Mangrovimonas sp. DI 80]
MTIFCLRITKRKINLIAMIAVSLSIISEISSNVNWGWISVLLGISWPILFVINVVLSVFGLISKRYLYLLGVLILSINLNSFFRISTESTNEPNESINILTFNVRGFNTNNLIKNKDTTSNTLKFIDSIYPDILVLQESDYKISRKIKGYDYEFLGYRKNLDKSLLSINSKYPIINKGYINFPHTKNNGIYADILIQNDTIRIYNLHLQSYKLTGNSLRTGKNLLKKIDNTFNQQVLQSKIVRENASNCTMKIIISGDLNTPPNTFPYNILKQNLNDSFIEKGNGLGTTYNLRGYPLRLDYFFMDQKIKILNHKNFKLNLSDHEPILVTFKL